MTNRSVKLYPELGIKISDLLREAHPQGGPFIGGFKEGKVEDSIEAQIRNLESFYKKPVATTLARLAERLDAEGAGDLAEQIDKVASSFFHRTALVKRAGDSKSNIGATIYKLLDEMKKSIDTNFVEEYQAIEDQFKAYIEAFMSEINGNHLNDYEIANHCLRGLSAYIKWFSSPDKVSTKTIKLKSDLNAVYEKIQNVIISAGLGVDMSLKDYQDRMQKLIDYLKRNQSLAQEQANKTSLEIDSGDLEVKINNILKGYQGETAEFIKLFKKLKPLTPESLTLKNKKILDVKINSFKTSMDRLKSDLEGAV